MRRLRKKIAVGGLGEFWYGDYKEPFMTLGDGFVPDYPQGVVLIDSDAPDARLLCAICGKTFENLGRHVGPAHGLPAREYKTSIGLLSKTALLSERLRVAHAERATRRRAAGSFVPREPSRRRPWLARAASAGGAAQLSPERLNKTGRCFAQALAVARQLARTEGRITDSNLRRHGLDRTVIKRYFGSMDHLRELMAMQPADRRTYTEEELLSALSNLAASLGRTPFSSDLRRFGLPSRQPYVTRFGSWSEACRRAGLDPNLPVPVDSDLELRVLNAYAVLGSVRAVCSTLHASQDRVLSILHRYAFPYPSGYSGPGRKEWAADMARRIGGQREVTA